MKMLSGLIWTPDAVASAVVALLLLAFLIWNIRSERKRRREYEDLP